MSKQVLVLLTVAFFLSACGGGGGGETVIPPLEAPNPDYLAISSTVPEHGAQDVEPDSLVRVWFENAIDPATLGGSSIVVESAFRRLPGTIDLLNGNRELRFTPTGGLPLGTAMRVTLSEDLRDVLGNIPEGEYVFRFDTRTAVAESPSLREILNGDMRLYDFQLSKQGKGAYVRLEESAAPSLRVHHYDTQSGFGAIVLLRKGTALVQPRVELDVNEAGDIAVLWTEFDGAQRDAYLRWYSEATGTWSSLVPIDTDSNLDVESIDVAMSDAGDILAAVEVSNLTSGPNTVRVRSLVAGGSWSNSFTANFGGRGARHPQVGFNILRQGFLAFEESVSFDQAIVCRRWTSTVGFTNADVVSDSPGEDCKLYQCHINDFGQVFAVHRHGGTGDQRLSAGRYQPGLGWQDPIRFEERPDRIADPVSILDEDGHLTVLWDFADTSTEARRFHRVDGLEPRQTLQSAAGETTSYHALTSSPDNHVMAFWTMWQPGSTYTVYGAEFNGTSWGPTRPIGAPFDEEDAWSFVAAAAGGALGLWSTYDDSHPDELGRLWVHQIERGMQPVAQPLIDLQPQRTFHHMILQLDELGRGAIIYEAEPMNSDEADIWSIEIR